MNSHNKYDIPGFMRDLGLTLEEVSEFYAELIVEINSSIIELKSLMANQDLSKIQKVVHNLKGVSGNYRISDVYNESTQINNYLKVDDYKVLEKDLNYLCDICTLAVNEIKTFFKDRSIYI